MDIEIDLSADSGGFVIDEVNLDSLSIDICGLTIIINDEQYESLKNVVKEWSGL